MNELFLFQIFECVAAVFEAFIIYQYLSGLFVLRANRRQVLIGYGFYTAGMAILTLYFQASLFFTVYCLIAIFILVSKLYKSTVSARIIATFAFLLLMFITEMVATGLTSNVLHLSINQVIAFGWARIFTQLITKLTELMLVKIVTTCAAYWKEEGVDRDDVTAMLPLLLCQAVLIGLSCYISVICRDITGRLSLSALLAVLGIAYVSIVIFWYFDRIKLAYAYKSKSEATEQKLRLQKQYQSLLTAHKTETDALWHDMKKHIRLLKALIAEGGNAVLPKDYIKNLETEMDEGIKIIRTSSPVLSALLTEQKRRAKVAQIPYDINVRIDGDLKIEDVDLCVMLENLFDNAFEACTLMPETATRHMHVEIFQRSGIVSIHFGNTFLADTRKHWHPGHHGLGLRNIEQTAQKYGGQFKISEANGIFEAAILIP